MNSGLQDLIAACEAEGLRAYISSEGGIITGELIVSGLDNVVDQSGTSSLGPIGQAVKASIDSLNEKIRLLIPDYQFETDGMGFALNPSALKDICEAANLCADELSFAVLIYVPLELN